MLGYVVCGKYSANESATVACHVVTDQNLNIQLEKMWEVENLDIGKALTQEEQEVENHFHKPCLVILTVVTCFVSYSGIL